MSSYADVAVVVNAPPTTGAFTATPAAGEVLITDFDLACVGWVDDADDLPLRYSFTSAIDGGKAALTQTEKTKDNPEQTLSSRSPAASFVTKLPQGKSASQE